MHNRNKVVEIYRSGDYSCSNSGDDKCPCHIAGGHFSLPTIQKFNYFVVSLAHINSNAYDN